MNEKPKHIWLKRLVSPIGAAYTALVCWFSYLSIFYEIDIPQKVLFCFAFSGISLVALLAMLYSRFQILTRLCSIVLLPAAFPLIMICFGSWEFIIPIAVTAVVIFFLSGAGDGVKTLFGVIYLLLYVLGSLAFFMIISFFGSSAQSTVLDSGASPSGNYRYEIIQIDDSSGGDVEVHVAPNTLDLELPLVTFVALGYDRTVYMQRPATTDDISVTWATASRSEITNTLLGLSEDLTLNLDSSQKTTLGLDQDTDPIYLRDLTDADLARLGVPEENDVMTFRGEIVFRSYTAILEDYFALSNRRITLLE